MHKIIDAITATPEGVKRQQIAWDQTTGLITDVGNLGVENSKVDYFYDDDCLLFAGMGDVHIHAREDVSGKNNYKETFATTSAAALNGGVVHCCDMPNNPIAPIDDESYRAKMALALNVPATLLMYAGIGPATNPLSRRVPYKAYMGPSVGDLFFKDHATLDQALARYRGLDVSFHCEDPDVLEACAKEKTHGQRRPTKAEVLATDQALALIAKYDLKGKLCHYSSGEGLKAVREFRKNGGQVEIEVTPQHLFFNESTLPQGLEHWYQMNPPIRPKADQEAMLDAFLKGEIEYLATDHAPHTSEEKLKGTSGMPGLDTYGLLVGWLWKEIGAKPELLAKTCSRNPGIFVNRFIDTWKHWFPQLCALGHGFGEIEKGYCASFTVLRSKRPQLVNKTHLKTKVAWSPFENYTFPCSIENVFHLGNLT